MKDTTTNRNRPEVPPSTGEAYVKKFLSPIGDLTDEGWIANAIDNGDILICPRCHFLHLPQRPFPLSSHLGPSATPLDACDVCSYLLVALKFEANYEDVGAQLEEAAANLEGARKSRAGLLYDLWFSTVESADALAWGMIGAALEPLREWAATETKEVGDAKA